MKSESTPATDIEVELPHSLRRLSPKRLSTVRELDLLDTPAEELFDSMTRLAATLLGAQAAFVSIVDADRDFYKSQFGFPDALAAARESKGETFCHHAIEGDAPLAIDDTHALPLWKAVGTVQTLGVRAYLGVPLVVDEHPIGSFCVVDTKPRAWTPDEVEMVSQLSKSAAREIELRMALRDALNRNQQAQALVRKREELLAVVAHDLRTPLQVIGTTVSMLTRAKDAATQAHAKRVADAIQSMSRLLGDLLSANASESGQMHLKTSVAVSRLLHDAVSTMSLIASRANMGLRVDVSPDVAITIDYAQLMRVLCNVIGNTVKYCAAGSTTILRARLEHDAVVIEVSDNGPGMSKDDQARAFERGWQGADGIAGLDGSGLGLSIVRTLIEQNGGTVSLLGDVGAGTTVAIRLPKH